MAIQTTKPKPLAQAAPNETHNQLRLVTLLIVLIIGVPSVLIFAPLGSAGTPADILGLIMLVTWAYRRLASHQTYQALNPVAKATLIFVAAVLASYVAAATRPIAELEISAADRGLLSVAAWLGMVLFASEAPRTVDQLNVLLRRLTCAGGALATLGLMQFVTKISFVNYIIIPGLQENADLSVLSDRNNFTRPAGTAIHSIEFGAVLTMILPFALHYALHDHQRSPIRRWYPVASIAAAVPISISRSAVLSATIVLLFMLPIWSRTMRRRAYAGIVALFGVLYFGVPGLLGTLTGLFTGISTDSSAQSRTDSYALATRFIERQPIFGRGFRTFLPSYRILDNQLLGTIIQMGFVGLAALLILMCTSVITALHVRKATRDPAVWQLGRAVAASIAAAGCSFSLFDAFSFPMAACTFFLILGCGGSLVHLTRSMKFTDNSAGPDSETRDQSVNAI